MFDLSPMEPALELDDPPNGSSNAAESIGVVGSRCASLNREVNRCKLRAVRTEPGRSVDGCSNAPLFRSPGEAPISILQSEHVHTRIRQLHRIILTASTSSMVYLSLSKSAAAADTASLPNGS